MMADEDSFWPEFIQSKQTDEQTGATGGCRVVDNKEVDPARQMIDLLLNVSCPKCKSNDAVTSIMDNLRQCLHCQELWSFDDTADRTSMVNLINNSGAIEPCGICGNDQFDCFTGATDKSELICGRCGNVYNNQKPNKTRKGEYEREANKPSLVCRNCKNRKPELFDKEFDENGIVNFSSCLFCGHVVSTTKDVVSDDDGEDNNVRNGKNKFLRENQNRQTWLEDEGAGWWQQDEKWDDDEERKVGKNNAREWKDDEGANGLHENAKEWNGDEGTNGWQRNAYRRKNGKVIPKQKNDTEAWHNDGPDWQTGIGNKFFLETAVKLGMQFMQSNGQRNADFGGFQEVMVGMVEPLVEQFGEQIGAQVGRTILKTEAGQTMGANLGSIVGQILALQVNRKSKKEGAPEAANDI